MTIEEQKNTTYYRGNTLSYAKRASKIMNEPKIKKQFRKHWKILQRTINNNNNNNNNN